MWKRPLDNAPPAAPSPRMGGDADAGDADDELDRLMSAYEAQAAAEVQAVELQEATKRARGAPGARQRLDERRREDALATPLAPDNKGFQMLAAMGFQPGQRLGKTQEGLAEPIPLQMKPNRLGLGAVSKKAAARAAAAERAAAGAAAAEAARAAADAALGEGGEAHRQRAASRFAQRRLVGQLRAAQQVCEALDTAAGIEANVMWAGWAEPPAVDEPATACGGEHGTAGGEAEVAEPGGEADPERAAWEALPPGERLAALLAYLRAAPHLYCLYCGARYADESDLAEHCPGPAEEDHSG